MNKFNFTKAAIIKLPIPKKGRQTFHDIIEKGLVLIITSTGTQSFYLRKRVLGKDERIFIGHFPNITIDQARKYALHHKSNIAHGKNPNDEKKKINQEITFGEMFTQFMERYSKKHKKSWGCDEREVNKFLSHWFNKKASSISKHEIQRLQEKIRDENGLYQSNRLFERIRAIYNKNIEWGWEGNNPTKGIKKYKEKSRDRFIQPDELPRFFQALHEEENLTAKDYIWISLLTGARKTNVLSMKWEDISFARKEWCIPDTKNGEAVTIALTEKAIEILDERRRLATEIYVFSSNIGSKGYFQDPKKAWRRILLRAGIEDLRLHDLRRTLGSYQATTGSSLAIIGKSLGHKTSKATEIYARMNLDPVRESVERATNAMLAFINNE